ncbi:MFS transporter, DHA3 family, multidrug efflux protein [Dyadobacter koreensis]|uniref:MFS transporter, DHA3 family, multidrug efflux protein n=1 Tax=Dyadobacter koreensis TaxID=408657 RepID=A0A1H6QTE1_9BACT|nr:MFS transporter [Dyadobacter koreensis]SEI43477.1 MFS transporter, DHA3 family, multidrug efflux protein [Dyadobacter koreensis]
MKTFYSVLANSLAASLTNTFVWFAVTFWVYLETKSVMATSIMAGVYLGTVAISGFFLGSVVDRYKKKTSMLISGVITLILYTGALIIYMLTPPNVFSNPSSISLWIFIILSLLGAITGNIRSIALSTVITILIPEEGRDKANGLVGTANGVSFLVASIFSGLIIGFMGMMWMLVLAVGLTLLVLIHLTWIEIEEKGIVHVESHFDSIDIRGTIAAVNLVPGLFGLIFFNTFNNFLGGVFMSLMDAYGLSLVSVQVWGALWGFLSLGFIIGGLVVAKKGLGKQPLKTLFLANIVMWTICIFFTIQASIILLAVGLFVYLCLIPVVEATEQTIMQKVIPPERQGRVFGFAQSVEQAASPLTAFMIGPIAKFIFIPFMTTGTGVKLIGSWFGTGSDRGLALLFSVTGVIGLIITLIAMQTSAYKKLSRIYKKEGSHLSRAESA